MKYHEETLARELFGELQAKFAGVASPPKIGCGGVGVHWDCTVQQGEYRAVIHCFSYRKQEVAEYCTSFAVLDTVLRAKISADLRTRCRSATIAAVADWMQRPTLPEFYARHAEVDFSKRAAAALHEQLRVASPVLASAEHCDLHEDQLRFRNGDRTASVGFPQPAVGLPLRTRKSSCLAILAWDRCELLTWGFDDVNQLTRLLQRWVLDRALPSQLEREFAGIEFNKFAKYYENGNPVEGEFIESWNSIQKGYAEFQRPFVPAALQLLAEMRSRGFDRTLRVGTSLYSIFVSRSRRHGMRDEQPCICFSFTDETGEFITGMNVSTQLQTGGQLQTTRYTEIALTEPIVELLQQLAAVPIE